MLAYQHVVERDDGRFEVGLIDPAGPFESRRHAEAVARRDSQRERLSPPPRVRR